MGKGLKKFLALVSVIGLASGMGALSCSADVTANKGANLISSNTAYEVFYKLKDGKTFDSYGEYFDVVKIDGKDFYKQKTGLKDDILKKANDALADFTTYYFGTNLNNNNNKKGLSNVAVAGISIGAAAAGAGVAVAIEELVVHSGKNCE